MAEADLPSECLDDDAPEHCLRENWCTQDVWDASAVCVEEVGIEPAPPVDEELPNAGFDIFSVLLIANVLGFAGLHMIRKEYGDGR